MTLPTAPQGGIPFVDQDRTLSNSGLIFLQQLRAFIISIGSGGGGGGGGSVLARTQRSITSIAGLPVVMSDSILNINAVADLTPVVPLASTRSGLPFTFKNVPGSHSQTITRTAPDTFDGNTTYVLAPGAYLTLVPYNDGVNSGYAIE